MTTKLLSQHNWVDVLKADDQLTLTVSGDCMKGVIGQGSRIAIGIAEYYWPGDVIVFPNAEHLLVHRVIGVYQRGGVTKILTQADRGMRPDKSILFADVIGKVLTLDHKPFRISLFDRLRSSVRFLRFVIAHCLRWTR
jgi:phage repressor protein C with HTH and peptisase S24 domain